MLPAGAVIQRWALQTGYMLLHNIYSEYNERFDTHIAVTEVILV